jgi:micrococcal nuclease
MYEYRCKVTKVVDGDTVKVDIDLGFGVWFKKQTIRMFGIDTPESRTSDKVEKKWGLLSKARLIKKIQESKEIRIRTSKDAKGKFGRILGTLISHSNGSPENGENINEWLVRHNYAVRYHGQSKDDVVAEHFRNRDVIMKRNELDDPAK